MSPTVENVCIKGKGGDHEGIPGAIEYEIQTAVKQAGGNALVTNEKMLSQRYRGHPTSIERTLKIIKPLTRSRGSSYLASTLP